MTERVAIQGIAGCYHETAAVRYFSDRTVESVCCSSFEQLFAEMAADRSLTGIVAIENTIAGSLLTNYELLRRSNLVITGEYKLRISHVLAALPGESLETLREVNSHPIALMQCEAFLKSHRRLKVVETADTAESARDIAEGRMEGHAAICSERAAQIYGLEVLERGIETDKHNFTRFLVVADRDRCETTGGRVDKASIEFTLPHTQGSLSKILTILSFYDVNLTKIQSMPIIGREWEYRFYVDVVFDDPVRYRQSIDAIRPLLSDFRPMGEYKAFKEQTSTEVKIKT